ncbi:MAG: nuclease domain-containing protein [Thiomicrospira sp.]
MSVRFEARIIDIKWKSKTEVSQINVSKFPIEVEHISKNQFELTTTVYSKFDTERSGLFAIKLKDSLTDIPFFSISTTEKKELTPVQDPVSGDTWWFAKDVWKEKYWVSDLFRTVGIVYLYVGAQQCIVKISANSFTVEQLESYLSSFRNDFLELILHEQSYVKGKLKVKQQNGFNLDQDILTVFSKYIDHADKILKKPKVELKEVQNPLPRKKLRPVPRSFMEIASKGQTARLITSRDYQENLNVAENRYLLYTLEKVLLITKSQSLVTHSRRTKLEQFISRNRVKLENFSDFITVDRELVLRDLENKEKNIQRLEAELNNINQYRTANYLPEQNERSLVFKITGHTGWEEGKAQFFVDVRKSDDPDWFRPNNGFCTLRVNDDDFVGKLGKFDEINVTGNILLTSTHTQKDKDWHQYFLNSISKVTFIKNHSEFSINRQKQNFNTLKHQIDRFEKTGWVRKLNRQETEEQIKEKASLQKLQALAFENQEQLKNASQLLSLKIPKIKSLISQLKLHKVRSSSFFPNSMSFIQNAHYQGIHSQFRIIKNLTGLDDELFSAIDEVEEVGLINISELYERWCLIQVISVLIQRFKFVPKEGWKKPFINAMLGRNPRNVQIFFHNDNLQRSVRLTYECELDNNANTKKGGNTRPDIVIDLSATSMKEKNKIITKRLVLDAKFKDFFNTVEHSSKVLKELYFDKDYQEQGKNSVFIIHPSQNSINPRKNPLNWAKSSTLGEVQIFDWESTTVKLQDQDFVNRTQHFHEFGSVYVSPTGDEDPLDNLQRLIGMFLQYSTEDNDLEGKISKETEKATEIVPEGRLFCISCGSHEYGYEWKQTKNGWKLWITCKNCNHFSVYNYCGGCRTRLIKNGSHWTYHATEPLEPLNIRCPKCAGIL